MSLCLMFHLNVPQRRFVDEAMGFNLDLSYITPKMYVCQLWRLPLPFNIMIPVQHRYGLPLRRSRGSL